MKNTGESQRLPDNSNNQSDLTTRLRLGVNQSGKLFKKVMTIVKPTPGTKKPPPRKPGGGKTIYLFSETEVELTRMRAPVLAYVFEAVKPHANIRTDMHTLSAIWRHIVLLR
jgi:hypothetical protein